MFFKYRTFALLLIFLVQNGLAQSDVSLDAKTTPSAPIEVSKRQSLADRLESFKGPVDSKNIASRYNEVSDLWEDVAKLLKGAFHTVPETGDEEEAYSMQNWQAEVARRFSLLRAVSRERGRRLEELKSQKLSLFKTDNRTLQRMGMEITLIPYKFLAYFYEKSHWVRQQFQSGLTGIGYLIFEFLILFALLLIPFFFIKVSGIVENQIEIQKRKSFYLSFRSNLHRNLTNFLPILSEYLPWIFTLLAIELVEGLLKFSEFQEITYLLPYVYYFVYYKLFRVTLELGLREFVSSVPMDSKGNLNKKIQSTSRFLGLVLFGIYSVKTAFQSILGQSLIFLMVEPFFGVLILAILFYVSARWELEIEKYLKNTEILVFKKYSKRMENRYSLFLSLPGLVLILFHFVIGRLVHWGSQFEFVKLIYARVLRVKYESTRDDQEGSTKIDEEYKEQFLQACAGGWKDFVLQKDFFLKISNQVEAWSSDANTEQTVAVFGSKGAGKSIFLKQCAEKFESSGYNCISIDVPPRIFTEKSFEQVFEPLPDIPKDKKTIVFLDNAHNLFLSTIGGFKIYQSFLEKTEEMENIFWVAAYNEYAWQFLNSVLGKNQYFRLELSMPRWSVEEIKEMILDYNSQLGYQLEYDQIFRSSQRLNEEVTSAESRFFFLIWERANGNPGLSVYYWFKSLRRLGEKRLKVCLPFDNPVNELAKLHQEMHFVYASLMKHENLNVSEAARATNLPRSVVKQAVYRGVEEGFLEESGGRYSVCLEWLDDVKKYLKGKNLIYELNG